MNAIIQGRDIPHSGEVADHLDVELAEEFTVTDTRALENLGSTEGTRA